MAYRGRILSVNRSQCRPAAHAFLGAPLLLGSFYGVIAGLALTILLMARIVGEEMMLARELEGCRAYMQNVRFRLFPFLW